MGEYQKINNIRVPIKYELRNVRRKKMQRYGIDTFVYKFVVFVNGRRTRGEESLIADSIKDLRKVVLNTYF